MLEGLEQVDWKRLRHAYGAAQDVPAWIWGLAAEDAATRSEAYYDLIGSINHQGMIMSATVAAVPFLIELLTVETVANKDYLLDTLIEFVRSCNEHQRSPRYGGLGDLKYEIDTYRNIAAGWQIYLLLLKHHETLVRFSSAQLLGLLTDQAQQIRLRLWRSSQSETNPYVASEMLYSTAKLIRATWQRRFKRIRQCYGPHLEQLVSTHPERIIRVAAACAWVKIQLPPNDPYVKTWRQSLPQSIKDTLAEGFIHPVEQTFEVDLEVATDDFVLGHLVRLGIYHLADVLARSDMSAFQAHKIAREMVDQVFARMSVPASKTPFEYTDINGFGQDC